MSSSSPHEAKLPPPPPPPPRHHPSLKQVLLGHTFYDGTTWNKRNNENNNNNSNLDKNKNNNNILVLDGGVSTHLKLKLGNLQDFAHRELWSSTLLLTPEGRELVKQGHLDWLQLPQPDDDGGGAGCGVDILSTVTYQCHYEQDLWPRVLRLQRRQGREQDDDDESSSPPERVTVMDELWEHGLTLAQQAVASYMAAAETAMAAEYSNDDDDDVSKNQQRQIRQHPAWVVASLGCFGAALANGAEYTGEYAPFILSKTTTTTATTSASPTKTTTTATTATVAEATTKEPTTNSPLPVELVVEDYLVRFHQQKLEQAWLHHPEAVAFETIPSLIECQAIAKLLLLKKETRETVAQADSPACWVSLACRNGDELNDGTRVETALEAFHNVPLDRLQAIGFNCCHCRHLPKLVGRLLGYYYNYHDDDSSSISRTTTTTPTRRRTIRRAIVLYPNWGESWDATTSSWKVGSGCPGNDEFVQVLWQCVELIQAKEKAEEQRQQQPQQQHPPQRPVTIILGGCCRTTPATIAALRRKVDEYYMTHSENES